MLDIFNREVDVRFTDGDDRLGRGCTSIGEREREGWRGSGGSGYVRGEMDRV